MSSVSGIRLWIQARRPTSVVFICILQSLHPWLASTTFVPLPSLLTGSLVDTPVAALAPILMIAVVQHILDTDTNDWLACAVVRFHLLDVGLVLVIAVLGLMSGLVGIWQMGSTVHFTWARNSLAYLGLGCVFRSIGGTKLMTLAPLIAGMVAIFFGRASDGKAQAWALPLADGDSLSSVGFAAILLVVGMLAAITLPPHQSWFTRKG